MRKFWSDTFVGFCPQFHFGPEKFGSREIWTPKNVSIKKFGLCTKMLNNDFLLVPNFHNSWGLNSSGTNILREPNEIRDHFRTSRYLKILWFQKNTLFLMTKYKNSIIYKPGTTGGGAILVTAGWARAWWDVL